VNPGKRTIMRMRIFAKCFMCGSLFEGERFSLVTGAILYHGNLFYEIPSF